jgi:hypothetical protein
MARKLDTRLNRGVTVPLNQEIIQALYNFTRYKYKRSDPLFPPHSHVIRDMIIRRLKDEKFIDEATRFHFSSE